MINSFHSKIVHFNLQTKIIILIVVNVLLFINKTIEFEWFLTGSSLIVTALNGQRKSVSYFFLSFSFMVLIEYALMPILSGMYASLILFLAVAVRKVLPCLIIGRWILTSTEVSEFIATMWKLHLPQDIIIPISVVFRYFPTLKEEWCSLRMAMKMRGIGISMEHIMVPLMMSAINISEELSAAALCRGLDNPQGHSCLHTIYFRKSDYIAMIFYTILLVAAFALKIGGIL